MVLTSFEGLFPIYISAITMENFWNQSKNKNVIDNIIVAEVKMPLALQGTSVQHYALPKVIALCWSFIQMFCIFTQLIICARYLECEQKGRSSWFCNHFLTIFLCVFSFVAYVGFFRMVSLLCTGQHLMGTARWQNFC